MPSEEHERKITEIEEEILSRSPQEWKTKRNYPVWIPEDNAQGFVDLVGFKRKTEFSPYTSGDQTLRQR